METNLSGNPLLQTEGLPQFSKINPDHVVPAIDHLIAEITRQFETIEQQVTPTWEGVVTALESLDVPFEYAWGPISHLLSVKNQDELRTAHQEVLPKVVALGLRMSQSTAIYKGLVALRDS